MSESMVNKITAKWTLPKVYLEYLAGHSKGQNVEGDDFVNSLHIYGSSELIKFQDGYSFNPKKKEIISMWPKDYVVIADDGGDPYVLDLSRSDGIDAPVLFAYHGEGKWDFKSYASSFTEFTNRLNIE